MTGYLINVVVVMANDFPDSVWEDGDAVHAYVQKKNEEELKARREAVITRTYRTPIFWRASDKFVLRS